MCDVLFVPAGWLVLEQPCKGSLVYGIRKTYIACSDKVVANFSAAMGALAVDAKGAKNPHMEALCTLLQEKLEAEAAAEAAEESRLEEPRSLNDS